MELRNNKHILIMVLLLKSVLDVVAQSQISLTPNPKDLAQCPSINIAFTLSSNFNPDCHTIEGDDYVEVISIDQVPNSNTYSVTLNFADAGHPAKVTIAKKTESGCGSAANGKIYDQIPIRTLVGLSPTITGPSTAAAGFVETLTFSASLNYPFKGTNDPETLPVTNFDWTLPTDWSNNTIPATSSAISVVTNIGGGGTITATGKTTCGAMAANSITASKEVNRTLSPPCPLIAQKLIERCGEPGTNAFAAGSQPAGYAANNPEWSWSLPQGWMFNGPINSQFINVTTNEPNGGNVTATFSDYGVAASCAINIPLVVSNPGTFVSGGDRLCETQTYVLTNTPLPSGSTASWSVNSPNVPVVPSSGNGTSATVTPGTSSGAGSGATITFTVAGCGLTETHTKSFFVGKPNILKHKINGYEVQSRVVCPGWHNLSATVEGDDTNPFCMTWQLVNNTSFPPHKLYDITCGSANLFIDPQNRSPASVKVTATNECGTYEDFFELNPNESGCSGDTEYSLRLYPNPTSGILHVEAIGDNGEETGPVPMSSIQVVGMSGVVWLRMDNLALSATELDLSSLPPGLYVAKVSVGDRMLTETISVAGN